MGLRNIQRRAGSRPGWWGWSFTIGFYPALNISEPNLVFARSRPLIGAECRNFTKFYRQYEFPEDLATFWQPYGLLNQKSTAVLLPCFFFFSMTNIQDIQAQVGSAAHVYERLWYMICAEGIHRARGTVRTSPTGKFPSRTFRARPAAFFGQFCDSRPICTLDFWRLAVRVQNVVGGALRAFVVRTDFCSRARKSGISCFRQNFPT